MAQSYEFIKKRKNKDKANIFLKQKYYLKNKKDLKSANNEKALQKTQRIVHKRVRCRFGVV